MAWDVFFYVARKKFAFVYNIIFWTAQYLLFKERNLNDLLLKRFNI